MFASQSKLFYVRTEGKCLVFLDVLSTKCISVRHSQLVYLPSVGIVPTFYTTLIYIFVSFSLIGMPVN